MLTKEAIESGHKVLRWSSTFVHFDKSRRADGDTSYNFGDYLTIRLVDGPGYRTNRSPQRLRHHRLEVDSFLRQVEKCEVPDLIFCCLPTPHLCRAAVDFGQRHKIPVVVDVRDLWPDHYLTIFPRLWRPWLKPLLTFEYRSLRHFLSRAAGVTAISESYLEWALTHGGRKRSSRDGVFPIGSSSQALDSNDDSGVQAAKERLRLQLTLRADDFVVIYVGTFVSSQDFHTVIQAAKRLKRLGYRIRFLFAGAGGYEAKMRRAAENVDSVVFLGWIKTNEELSALLQLANVGISPYRRGCTMSLPNKPFEYMAFGLPQISSLEGEMAEIIKREEVGMQYISDDVDGLCNCLIKLATDKLEAKRLGDNARRLYLKCYSSEVIYPKLLKHLQQVAELKTAST